MSRKTWTNEKLFYRLLNNKSGKTHWNNIRELRSRGGKDIFKKCVELVRSNEPNERLIGVEILSQLGIPPRLFIKQIFKLFFETLRQETHSSVISTMFYGFGHNSEYLRKNEIKSICSFKDNRSAQIRVSLAFALSAIDDDVAIDTLIYLSTDKVGSVRDWATFGIGSQSSRDTDRIREALWNRVSDKHFQTRQEAIYGLAVRKDPRIKEVLKGELKVIDNRGSYILEAIEVFHDEDFVDLLKKKINSNRREKKINPDWLKSSLKELTK